MFFWKIGELMDVLASEGLNQKSSFGYMLISVVLMQVIFETLIIWPSEPGSDSIVISIFNILIVASGTYYCYFCNGKEVGKQFIERYLSLSLVVTIRQLVFMALPVLLISTVAYGYLIYENGEDADVSSIDSAIDYLLCVWVAYIYFLVGRCINQVALRGKSQSESTLV